jgi:hypothetical protein
MISNPSSCTIEDGTRLDIAVPVAYLTEQGVR